MYTTYLFAPEHPPGVLDGGYEELESAVLAVLQHWHEDAGPQMFWVCDQLGCTHAVILRGDPDEIALVLYREGLVESFEVRYILDSAGRYVRTSIRNVTLELLGKLYLHRDGSSFGAAVRQQLAEGRSE